MYTYLLLPLQAYIQVRKGLQCNNLSLYKCSVTLNGLTFTVSSLAEIN